MHFSAKSLWHLYVAAILIGLTFLIISETGTQTVKETPRNEETLATEVAAFGTVITRYRDTQTSITGTRLAESPTIGAVPK